MADNISARAMTSGELIKQRSPGQWCKLGLSIQRPATVYQMRINQTFSTLDRVASLAFDGGSGVAADVIAGMTVLVSSSAGGHEKGILRVRRITFTSAGVGVLDINETSKPRFADNDYITIVESMAIWQKDINVTGGVFMDYDIAFGSYLNYGAIGRVGPQVSIVKIDPDTLVAEFHPLDPSQSACYDGATVVSHHYVCPGAVSVTDADTTAPTMTFDTPGQYLWWDEITDDLGRVTPTYRWVYVNPVSEQFKILKWSGDLNGANWAFKIHTSADMSDIYDRAMVTLYSIYEAYTNAEGVIGVENISGPLAGYENIKATGWIDGATIYENTIEGYVEFEVKSAAFWASKLRAFPFGITDTSTDPTDWVHIKELTVDKALAHLLFWCSTMTSVMDCFFTDDTIRFKTLDSPASNLWQQIKDMTINTIFAQPRVNHYGQLIVQVDAQMLSDADRSALPVIQHITPADYLNGLDLQANQTDRVSKLRLAGISAWDGTASSPLSSDAPGSIGGTFGEPRNEDNYGFVDQADCNYKAGRLYALANNPFEPFELELAGQNNFFDICPLQLATIDISAADNPYGIAMTAAKIIPRSVELEYNEDTLFLKTVVSFEFVVMNTVDGITYVPPAPVVEDLNYNYVYPKIPKVKVPKFPLGNTYFPPFIPNPIPPNPDCGNLFTNSYSSVWDKPFLKGTDSDRVAKLYLKCTLHGSGGYASFISKTPHVLDKPGVCHGDAASNYTIYGVKDGVRVITADSLGRFNPISETPIDWFELEINAGLGADFVCTPGSVLGSASFPCLNFYGEKITGMTDGLDYAIDGACSWLIGNTYPYNHESWRNYCFGINTSGANSGAVGRNGWGGSGGAMSLDTPAICVFSEALDTNNARTYLIKSPGDVYLTSYDTDTHDNSGVMGYVLRRAFIKGRQIDLGAITINNVCPQALP